MINYCIYINLFYDYDYVISESANIFYVSLGSYLLHLLLIHCIYFYFIECLLLLLDIWWYWLCNLEYGFEYYEEYVYDCLLLLLFILNILYELFYGRYEKRISMIVTTSDYLIIFYYYIFVIYNISYTIQYIYLIINLHRYVYVLYFEILTMFHNLDI